MIEEQRVALASIRLNWAPTPDDVWQHSPFHVEGLHGQVAETVLGGLRDARTSSGSSPIGIVLQGQRGAGKTHLLGWLRERVWAEDGYFFLVSLLDSSAFWRSTVVSMLDGMARKVDGPETQLRVFLRRLCAMIGVADDTLTSVVGDTPLTREILDSFVGSLRRFDRQVGLECQDTVRALVLLASDDLKGQDIAEQFLSSADEEEPGERSAWGMHRGKRSAQLIVRDLSRLLALTGPSVIAVDQIDTLIAQSAISTAKDARDDWQQALVLEQIAGGLMALRELTRRTLTVVACIPVSWTLIKNKATDTVRDRFREARQLQTIPSVDVGRALVEKRFGLYFREANYDPPYPTWPVKDSAFISSPEYTPRQLLIEIDNHIRACLASGEIRELEHLDGGADPGPQPPVQPEVTGNELDVLDARFLELRKRANVAAALIHETENAMMPALLSAGLAAWIIELGPAGQVFTQDPPPSMKAPLHARLRRSLDEATEDEVHWGFRAIATRNARAAQCRIRDACTMAGLTDGITKRKLFLLRNGPWPTGPVTREVVAAFTDAGGVTLDVSEEDLRILAALRDMQAENSPKLSAWLIARRPTSEVAVLREALADAFTDRAPTAAEKDTNGVSGEAEATEARPIPEDKRQRPVTSGPSIPVGMTIETGKPVAVELEALRKHTAIFAGSGSGKTVLIRRLVEECALQGVSAIVLDPNNDLARLGDRRPNRPPGWGEGDAAKAEEYLEHTDVVVWTPRREAGRPLAFQPLPDFRSVIDDTDEFGEAVEAAVAALAPRAKVVANTTKADRGQAVLRQALRFFGLQGGSNLRSFIAMLGDLPDRVSELEGADKIAADLAQTLTAAMVNDPLFGGDGQPLDPGILLTPAPGKRARVSVISFIGLPSDEQRQSFVNQLQMGLFAWIKKHPAGDRPLGGLFVMDEAQTLAPSGAMTACTQSTLALASQARKYGLGLVFATQAPKGLNNRIPGNAATQFFGLLNAPVQISAAREMAQAKGSDVPDISRLRAGQFYAAVEGSAFEKVMTPLCLSDHPSSPLTVEEVIVRARRA
jgi:hypothetical protein